jgi:cell division septation protein DedD
MAKDYAKFVPPKKHAKKNKKRYGGIITAIFILLTLSALLFFYPNVRHVKLLTALGLVAADKKTRAEASNDAPVVAHPPPLVHFDFYDALSQAKLPPPAPPPVLPVKTAIPASPGRVANQVTHLLAAEKPISNVSKQHYIVELGVFETEIGARRWVDAIRSVGFAVNVVKVAQGRFNLYYVQQGPYETLELAKMSQQRLKTRGIVSVVKKSDL